jgi:hypothetical protein
MSTFMYMPISMLLSYLPQQCGPRTLDPITWEFADLYTRPTLVYSQLISTRTENVKIQENPHTHNFAERMKKSSCMKH